LGDGNEKRERADVIKAYSGDLSETYSISGASIISAIALAHFINIAVIGPYTSLT